MPFKVPSSFEIPSAVQRAFQGVGDNLNALSTNLATVTTNLATLTTKVDKNYFKCTSTTRPASPTSGDQIFETDTLRKRLYDGTGWLILSEPTQTYTPTLTNIALGTGGSISARYHRCDGWCDLKIVATLGSSGFSVTGNPIFSYPSGLQPIDNLSAYQGNATLYDATGSRFYGNLYHDSYNSIGVTTFYALAAGGGITGLASAGITSTTPYTWAANDAIIINLRFEFGTGRYS